MRSVIITPVRILATHSYSGVPTFKAQPFRICIQSDSPKKIHSILEKKTALKLSYLLWSSRTPVRIFDPFKFIINSNTTIPQNTQPNKPSLTVPWLTWLVTHLSPRRHGFDPSSVHVKLAVDKVVLEHLFFFRRPFLLYRQYNSINAPNSIVHL